jgi:phosphotransferase system HPr (HPr) family protein
MRSDNSPHGSPRRQEFLRRTVKVYNPGGLDLRRATQLVRCVGHFNCEVTLIKGDERFFACSVFAVLIAQLRCGEAVEIEAVGADAEEALTRIEQLFESFGDSKGSCCRLSRTPAAMAAFS